MDLHKKISDSINKTYENKLQDHIQLDKTYWHSSTVDFTGDNIKVYDLKIECLDLFCLGAHVLLVYEEEMKIYKFTNEMTLKNIKSLKNHFLFFLIKKKALSEGTKNFFYKILLILVYDKTTRIESHLEGIMLHLNVDKIVNIKEYKDYIEIKYKNKEKKYYNNKLVEINKPQEHSLTTSISLNYNLRLNTLITLSTKNIFIFKNLIKIEFNSGISKKEIEMKKIEKVVESKNFLLLKNKSGIKVLRFT